LGGGDLSTNACSGFRRERFGSDAHFPRVGTTPMRTTMNWNRVAGNWKRFKGTIKQKWARLVRNDLAYLDGRWDELAGRIQERYGIAQEHGEDELHEWRKTLSTINHDRLLMVAREQSRGRGKARSFFDVRRPGSDRERSRAGSGAYPARRAPPKTTPAWR
jgi:uncharacterized protein YjbJ (UPF0337 family)